MKTVSLKPADIKKSWVVVDATDQVLGRLASQIAYVLRGKHKASFVPYWDCGDNVVVTHASQIKLTGRKWEQKSHYYHTGYVGGIKEISAKNMRDNNPERLIKLAVKRMLPKNKLADKMLSNLKIYPGAEHPHEAQKPQAMPMRTAQQGEPS